MAGHVPRGDMKLHQGNLQGRGDRLTRVCMGYLDLQKVLDEGRAEKTRLHVLIGLQRECL